MATKNQNAYDQEVKRITDLIEKMTKQGHTIHYNFPTRPKAIRQNKIDELKNVQFVKNKLIDVSTGEIYSVAPLKPSTRKQRENKKKTKKVATTMEVDSDNLDDYSYQKIHQDLINEDRISPNSVHVFDVITDLIEAIPTVIPTFSTRRWKWDNDFNWQSTVPLMQIFIHAMETYDNDELAQYYESNMNDIVEGLTLWYEASVQEDIIQGFSRVAKILNYGYALTSEQASGIGNNYGESE